MKDDDEERKIWKELGLSKADLDEATAAKFESKPLNPALALGLGAFVLVNVGFLLSLPPVLRGRGAPYLPTFQKNMNAMFVQLRKEPKFMDRHKEGAAKLNFVDLGSGDGRIVFRASRENLFSVSVGYEINPLLHMFASLQRILRGPKAWSSTRFHLQDLWSVDLRDADVVAVYGLAPIMKDLGVKLEDELKPGSYVLSNVFSIPGWKPVNTSSDGTFIYRTPHCWQHRTPSSTTKKT